MQKKVQFALSDISRFDNDEDAELAVAKVDFLSTAPNSHRIKITEEILRRDAPSILSKFLVAKMNLTNTDATSHSDSAVIMGYFPKDQEVEFTRKDNSLVASAKVIVSKLYATPLYEAFKRHNHKAVSIEMLTDNPEEMPDGTTTISGLHLTACSVLGEMVRPSCPNAQMEIVRFSAEEADEFYNKHYCSNELKKFAEERRKQMAEGKTYKINKTELKETPWGDVDKTELRDKVMNAKNRDTLVREVYALVEDGWEDAPSEHLKYPIMEESNGVFYYNRYALASALAYAKQENETSVIEKIEKLYKKFDLDERGETEMAECKEEEKMEEVVVEETTMEETPVEEKPEKDHDDEEHDEEEHDEDKEEEMSADANVDPAAEEVGNEIEAEKNKELAEKLAEKEDIIMKYEAELAELRKFKCDTEKMAQEEQVNRAMAEVKDYIKDEEFKCLQEEGMACAFADLNGWVNKVKSVAFEGLKNHKVDNDTFRVASCEINVKTSKGLWD